MSITTIEAPTATERPQKPGHPTRQILGIRFFAGSLDEAVELGLQGGLVVAPAAPNLINLVRDPDTSRALLEADVALTDSGLMVLVWLWLTGERIPRVSGLKYLERMLKRPVMHEPASVFWVMPGKEALERNVAWLRAQDFPATAEDGYVAPFYGASVADPALVERINARRPEHIVICLGGGTQERLGHYLREHLDYRPGIHCIGAAIGFLNGDQVSIPDWADRFFLGWLIRCLYRPHLYVPRYWRAWKLVRLMHKYRDRRPELKGAAV